MSKPGTLCQRRVRLWNLRYDARHPREENSSDCRLAAEEDSHRSGASYVPVCIDRLAWLATPTARSRNQSGLKILESTLPLKAAMLRSVPTVTLWL